MGGLLWAFGSMLIAVLIVYFLPIGFSKWGKIIVPVTGFLLALGGLAAAASFALWQTLVLLIVLILFVSYIFDSRLGSVLFITNDNHEKDQAEAMEQGLIEKSAGRGEKGERTLTAQNDILKKKAAINPPPLKKQQDEAEIPYLEQDDEDISFLLNRSISMEEENSQKTKEPQHEVDYLSELEEILTETGDEAADDTNSSDAENIEGDTDHEIPVITFTDPPKKDDTEDPNRKQDSQIEGIDEIPVLPFHEKEGEK